MDQRIHESSGGSGDSRDDQTPPFREGAASGRDQSDGADGRALRPTDAHLVAVPADSSSPQTEEVTQSHRKGLLSWLRRLLFPGPAQPRKSQRESLSWLIAYFFTGGTPVAHLVRDVSFSGMYVFTEERWYLGTVVRITLTDRRQPTPERSLTLNARVVRWGEDGVGLQFLLQDGKSADSGLVPILGDSLEPIGKRQLEQYLEHIKTGTN